MIQYHYQSYSKYARISIRITTDSIDCSNSIESRRIMSAGCRPQWWEILLEGLLKQIFRFTGLNYNED